LCLLTVIFGFAMKLVGVVSVFTSVASKKAGLSGIDFCDDAKSMNLEDSWYYHWGSLPDGKGMDCTSSPRATEFVPMFWSCGEDCSTGLDPDYWSLWMKAGVKYILGFNEPDNEGQSNMTPAFAAAAWVSLQTIAAKFNPPLELVSPAMTHWSEDGTPWLDQFFGNCSEIKDCDPSSVKYVAFHDYGGDADTLIKKANGAAKKYGRPIWLTEFSVGSQEHRDKQDAFIKDVIPKLEAADSVFRYAWYSTRNYPDTWVAESSLLPYYIAPWHKRSDRSCAVDELKWLSGASWGRGNLAQCGAKAASDTDCAAPVTIVYENGGDNNCYCATSACTDTQSKWQDRYVYTPSTYKTIPGKVCTSESDMLWLNSGDLSTLQGCEALADLTGKCAHPKTIAFESGGQHNCYCSLKHECELGDSSWLDLHVQQGSENATSLALTSTGKLYKSLVAASEVVV